MSDFDLQDKFPDLRPIKSPPSLGTLNGFGLGMYGARDHDEETGTYVKTHCACALFIPVLALKAYRVADAQDGWYFLGRVPLSALAKVWNFLLLLVVLGGIGLVVWHQHTHSAAYLAGQKMDEADRLAQAGKVGDAARLYREVAEGNTKHASEALTRIKDLLADPVARVSPAEAVVVFQTAVGLANNRSALPDLFDRGIKVVDQHARSDPRGALAILDAVAPLARNGAALTARRRRLLEALVAREPTNPEPATALALIYEEQRQLDKCEKLLAPHRKRLGGGEGARILGHIYANQGKLEQAHALLGPYATIHLKKLHQAEQNLRQAEEGMWKAVEKSQAADFPYERYRRGSAAEKQVILQDYRNARMKTDPGILAARAAILREARVVPVALDLGIVLLRRAQGLADPAARRKELEKAEKMFLAIRGLAGQADQYRLHLAQVYYWLGKHAEGRKLFDELLASKKRDSTWLVIGARLLREVGATADARALAEEAYAKEKDPNKKYNAAGIRSVMNLDTEDRITWLRRCNPASPEVKASLSSALGHKAAQDGNDEEAAKHYRQAIATYNQMAENESVLNNSALVYLDLYRLTGERAALKEGGERLARAIALRPDDSILLFNAANALWEAALRDVLGSALDLKALKTGAGTSQFSYLYKDRAGRDRYLERVKKHPQAIKALAYFDRLLVLAPKNADAYSTLVSIHKFRRDLKALQGLLQRLESVELDLSESTRKALDFATGKEDAKNRKDLSAAVARYEKVVKETRKGGGTTFAVAANYLAAFQIGLDQVGQAGDPDAVVALAEEAHAAAPSTATQAVLVQALLFRASRSLAREQPAYAAMLKKALRSLGHSYLIAVALAREDTLRQAILANKDVKRALELVKEDRASFPGEADEWAWALLRASGADTAREQTRGLLQDELGRVRRAINLKLSPVNASVAFRAYWALQAAGKEAEGVAILKRYAARGVPLPFDPQ